MASTVAPASRAHAATRLARRALDVALVILIVAMLATLLLARVAPAILGGSTFVVGGASMEPAIPVGAAVLAVPVDPSQIREGDVLSLLASDASSVVTHRVVRVIQGVDGASLETRGDANVTSDPSIVPVSRVIGRVELTLPLAGFLIAMLGSAQGVALLVSSALLLLGMARLLGTFEAGPRQASRRRTALPFASTVSLVAVLALVLLNLLAVAPATGALFSSTQPVSGQASTGRIFPGHRVTPAFSVADSSSGATVDRSSPIAYPGDGRWSVSHPWPTAFAPDRVLELALNHPLPAGLDAPSAQLAVTLASDDAGGTACWFADIIRTSNGAVLSTHGSAASPLACVVGTTFVRTLVSLSGVTGSDLANDLTIRLHGRSSTGAAARVDEVTVSGATSYAPFTLYPVETRDASDGHLETVPWQLAGE